MLLPLDLLAAEHCEIKSNSCIEGRETRTINGVEVTNDCWKYSTVYSCYDNEVFFDSCTSLQSNNLCQQSSATNCILQDSGTCIKYESGYTCDSQFAVTEGITLIDTIKEISNEYIDSSACDIYADNSQCVFEESNCIDDQAEKIIDGLSVTKECWKYEDSYECKSDSFTDNCAQYDASCVFQSKTCLVQNDGECSHYERIYQCQEEGSHVDNNTLICGTQTYCINGECADATYEGESELASSIAQLKVATEAGNELDKDNLSIFPGQQMSCDKAAFGYNACCSNDGIGQDLGLASCKPEEKMLIERRKAKQCRYIGSYCAKKKLWTCLEKRSAYCCFDSKISRIVHEQGRPQIDMVWGAAESPNCTGLTPDELSRIDFDEVDLSELYEDFSDVMVDSEDEKQNELIERRVRDAYSN